ncbi:hypothetical protein [Emticicia soli]|uniref:Outer membrane porin, OprD family n=1 Tax=Emticicia soli TaxID=2027878 RepID=A0ABW5J0E3_9BACT
MRQINMYYLLGSFFISVSLVEAQNLNTAITKDTNNLGYKLKNGGRFYFQARSYFSSTFNKGELTDYYAWGIGAGVGYETPKLLKHFQLGISSFSVFNLASSDLTKADPLTNQVNRYEIGLFDIEQPEKHQDLNRLEELFIKAHLGKKSKIVLGRQIPQSPFINIQDGRMRPTLIEAAVLDLPEWKNLSLHAEYIWEIAPRSTMKWYSVGQSIGLYPVGVGVNGEPSLYKNNTFSAGVGVLGINYRYKAWNIQLWDNYVDNLTNTGLLKIEWRSNYLTQNNWLLGIQLLRQQTIGNGGNQDPAKAYAPKNNSANIVSARFGKQTPKFTWFLNATRIGNEGRYLMPREWGKEPFYTFIPRERNEGFGNLSAFTMNLIYKPATNLKLEMNAGYFRLPDVKDFQLNKYAMPAYTHINMSLNYQFKKYLKGLDLLLLAMRKDPTGNTYQNPRFIFNKVNMTHLNLVMNYQY